MRNVHPRALAANTAWCLANVPAWRRYRRALQDPARVQERLLLSCLRRNAETAFGRAHGFARIRSIARYQAGVPCMRYEDYEPLIRRAGQGERCVLTAERVLRLAVTSGSSAAAKLIPYTRSLQAEYARAVAPWIVDLFATHPRLAGGRAYWSITPQVESPALPGAAVPVGFDEDSRYLGGLAHRLVEAALAVPSAVRQITDHQIHRYITLLFLLKARDLRLISVWHPSYLSLLLDGLHTGWDALLADIRTGGLTHAASLPAAVARALRSRLAPDDHRARELERAGPDAPKRIWPDLRLVSCWGEASARGPLDVLRRRLPGTFVQPKGLLATEAVVTVPFRGPSRDAAARIWRSDDPDGQPRPLAVCSHFFEFADGSGRIRLAHELERDAVYEVIVTTGGGLYRYRLGDRVRVDGVVGRTPSLAFVGRESAVSDRVGEKLHESFVSGVIARLFERTGSPRFAMLSPEGADGGISYTLFADTAEDFPPALAQRLETALRENPHYALAVDLGQLARARAVRIRDGFEAFARRAAARGRQIGGVKPIALDVDGGWLAHFTPADPAAVQRDGTHG